METIEMLYGIPNKKPFLGLGFRKISGKFDE